MNKNKYGIALLALIIIMQKAVLSSFGDESGRYIFASGLKLSNDNSVDATKTLFLLFPIFLLIFIMGGKIQDVEKGYWKLLIIRNVSKKRLYLRLCYKKCIQVLMFVVMEILWYTWNPIGFSRRLKIDVIMFVCYYMTLMAMVMIQSFLELYWQSTHVMICLLVYMTLAVFIGEYFQIKTSHFFAMLFTFPNLLFGYRNGCLGGGNIILSIGILLLLNLGCIIISVRKYQKVDIY